jgi:hypothetical protein
LSNGEQGYPVGIVVVPVLDTVADIERVEHASPRLIDAHQVDNPVDNCWGTIKARAAPLQILMPENRAIRAVERIECIVSSDVYDIADNGDCSLRTRGAAAPGGTVTVYVRALHAPVRLFHCSRLAGRLPRRRQAHSPVHRVTAR